MYLYLGEDTVIRTHDIVGIFDIDKTTVSRVTRDYLTCSQKTGRIVEVTGELPKSYVVCSGTRQVSAGRNTGGTEKLETRLCPASSRVYLSQISPATLLKRVTDSM